MSGVLKLGRVKDIAFLTESMIRDGDTDLNGLAEELGNAASERDLFVEQPETATEVYFAALEYQELESIRFIRVTTTFSWARSVFVLYGERPDATESINTVVSLAEDMRDRASGVGAVIEIDQINVPVVASETLRRKVLQTANQRTRRWIAESHVEKMASDHLEDRGLERAMRHAELAVSYSNEFAGAHSNNLGYLFVAAGQYDRARGWLERAEKEWEQDPVRGALASYNLAVVDAVEGRLVEARERVSNVKGALIKVGERARRHGCLFVLRAHEGGSCSKRCGRSQIYSWWRRRVEGHSSRCWETNRGRTRGTRIQVQPISPLRLAASRARLELRRSRPRPEFTAILLPKISRRV